MQKLFQVVCLILATYKAQAKLCVCVENVSNYLNIRSCGSTSCNILGTEESGACFEYLGISGNWISIQYGALTAYAHKNYLSDPCDTPCHCVTATALNFRSCASTSCNILGTEDNGACFEHVSNSGVWREVKYDSGTAYAHGNYLTDVESCSAGGNCANVEIVPRSEWGAISPSASIGPLPNKPVEYGFVHHSATSGCFDQSSCETQVKNIQNYHMNNKVYDDIGYSFLVGEDGRAYEGRGWDKTGAHTFGHNEDSVGVCVIGDFTSGPPNQAALDALNNIFNCAVEQGVLASNYKMYGHRDARCTACPGTSLYSVIQTWPQYSFDSVEYFC